MQFVTLNKSPSLIYFLYSKPKKEKDPSIGQQRKDWSLYLFPASSRYECVKNVPCWELFTE